MDNKPKIPNPIINDREKAQIPRLEKKYNKLTESNALVKLGNTALDIIPESAKDFTENVKAAIGEKELIQQALKYALNGFQTLEEIAAQVTISEKAVIKKVNKTFDEGVIDSLDEICYARSYDLSRIVGTYRRRHIFSAAAEGAGTGAMGVWGIVPNLAASVFLYFRAVQSIAMHYGYDAKNDSSEMEIASGVFMAA